jgi:hypothetical protein
VGSKIVAATISAILIGMLILGGIGAIVNSYNQHTAKIAHQIDQKSLNIRPAPSYTQVQPEPLTYTQSLNQCLLVDDREHCVDNVHKRFGR